MLTKSHSHSQMSHFLFPTIPLEVGGESVVEEEEEEEGGEHHSAQEE